MSAEIRSKKIRAADGRFEREKILAAKRKRSETLRISNENKRKKDDNADTKNNEDHFVRLVDLNEFTNSLRCQMCKEYVNFDKRISEKRNGVHSEFKVPCDKCHFHQNVRTGTITNEYPDLNYALSLGK